MAIDIEERRRRDRDRKSRKRLGEACDALRKRVSDGMNYLVREAVGAQARWTLADRSAGALDPRVCELLVAEEDVKTVKDEPGYQVFGFGRVA